MARSKHKREKREETTEEFVKRINQHKESGKRNGSKRRTGRHHHGKRHPLPPRLYCPQRLPMFNGMKPYSDNDAGTRAACHAGSL